MAVGSASPAMTTGSRRSRAASLGEYDDVWIWAATKTAENTIPVKVIMPPASAPKIACTAVMAIGRLPWRRCAGRGSAGRGPAPRPGRSPPAPVPTSPSSARSSAGTAGRPRGPRGAPGGASSRDRNVRMHGRSLPGGARSAAMRRMCSPWSGPASVESAPAPTSAAAVEERMWPSSTATVVIATTSGSCVAVNSASAMRSSFSGSTRR